MPITSENILAHEWIGLRVSIVNSSNPQLRGVSGIVRDETRNTLTIETNIRMVTVPKSLTTLVSTLPANGTVKVEGKDLRHRPEDRVKKGVGKW